MIARTVKSAVFTIVVGDKRIVIKHVFCKGKRCRVILPPGAIIEEQPCHPATGDLDDQSTFSR